MLPARTAEQAVAPAAAPPPTGDDAMILGPGLARMTTLVQV